jgi:hypothetical protein
LPGAKELAADGNPTQILRANRQRIRLESPGRVFCSIKTSGTRFVSAAKATAAEA